MWVQSCYVHIKLMVVKKTGAKTDFQDKNLKPESKVFRINYIK